MKGIISAIVRIRRMGRVGRPGRLARVSSSDTSVLVGRDYTHKPVSCQQCGTRYKTLTALDGHACNDCPGYLGWLALKALEPFQLTSDLQARTLLAMWARRKDMTEAEYDYARKEAIK